MGEVWQAERADGTLKRKVALKLPHVTWAPGSPSASRASARSWPASSIRTSPGCTTPASTRTGVRTWRSSTSRACRSTSSASTRAAGRRAPAPAAAGGRGGGVRAQPAGGSPRPQAGQHPGDRRRPGASARLRHRQADGRRLGAGDRADARRRPRVDAGLRKPRADPRRADRHRERRLFAWRRGVRAAGGARPYKLKRGARRELEEAIAHADAPLASAVATMPR